MILFLIMLAVAVYILADVTIHEGDKPEETSQKILCHFCGEEIASNGIMVKGTRNASNQEVDYFLHKGCAEETNYLGGGIGKDK